nr:hypothetical protein [Tanacetum cinerariifolium]
MRTRRFYFPQTATIPHRSRKHTSNVVEPEIRTNVEMADNRTMAQMLQAPIEGYEDAIVVPPINANNFELKQTHPEVPNTTIKLLRFSFSLEGEARIWVDKEPSRSILTWEAPVSKFINQFFPPSKTTYLRNEITNFLQKPNETFNEAWERFKDLLRKCPHHVFSELHQLDTFYNTLNPNDQDALDFAAGENFLDKIPRECLLIIESKSKEEVRIQLQAKEFYLMVALGDLDEIEEVNANCILMVNLQQASTSATQTDKALVYDSNGSAEVIQICLWCTNSGCSKHMTRNLKLLINFVWKFLGTIRFGNDHIAAILVYSDLKWGNILITKVYFVEGLGHNLFSIGQFYLNIKHQKRLKSFWKKITVLLQASVIVVRTANDPVFKNQLLQEHFNSVGISHQAFSVRIPQQNGVVSLQPKDKEDNVDNEFTYTSVYTDSEPWRYYEEDSAETGPLRVIVYGSDGLPIQPVASPSPDYVPSPEHPPSPYYVPGPKYPPSPVEIPYVPEPKYPEYLAPSDDEAPLEDQPLPANASPIAASLDYVADFDPEEDPEDDQADYPADGGDGDNKSSDDDNDDDTDDEDLKEEPFEDEEDDEEEEHLAPADSSVVPIVDLTVRPKPPMSVSMEACIARHDALPSPPLLIPSPPLPLSSPLTIRLTDTGAPLCYRAAGIRMRALVGESFIAGAARQPGPTESNLRRIRVEQAGYGITDTWDEIVDTLIEIAPTTLEGVDQRVTELDNTVRKRTDDFEIRFEEAQDDRALLRARVNTLFIDRPDHHRTTMLMDREAMYACEEWAYSEDRSLAIVSHVRTLEEQGYHVRLSMLLSERDADRSRNGDNSNDSGTCGRSKMTTPRECTYIDFLKCQPMSFQGTEGVVGLTRWLEKMESVFQFSNCTVACQVKFASCTLQGSALTWWNSYTRAVGQDVTYATPWVALKKMITSKYCPKEAAKVERYISGLTDMIHGSVKASKPQSMQEAIEFATKMMDKKMLIHAERQAEQKRKLDDTSRNNQHQHHPFKRNNVACAYTVGPGDKKPYGGTKPLCLKCNYHHDGPFTPKCTNYKKIGHWTCDSKVRPAANNNNNPNNKNQRAQGANARGITCFECGVQGHYKSECPKLKNGNQGNRAGNRNAVARAYAVGTTETNPNSNVVTGTFLLNNRYASTFFDTGADRSFVSTAFSSLIDIILTIVDHGYDVELADGRIIWVNTLMRGCTLNFLNHPFNINLMLVEMVSFDVIIGMDRFVKYHAVIVCDEKLVHVPFSDKIIIFHGDGSNNGHESRLNIISCTKTQRYLLKGCPIFLAHVTTKEVEDKSKEKRLEEVPIVQDFPEVFPEDLPGIPPTCQVEFQIDLVPGATPVARAPY